MLKRLVNNAVIKLTITPVDPLLIKSSQATVSGVNMSFVRTRHRGGLGEPFIPGSSLKGVLRSYGEKICRTLRTQPVPVCLPYVEVGREKDVEKGQASCGLRFEKYKKDRKLNTLPTNEIYRHSCPACRLFGSHDYIGRLATSDAYLSTGSSAVFEVRDGVAIDRLTGGAAGSAKYDLEVLVRGTFSTTLEIQNFERWQLGMVALILRDMEQELIRIGSGGSRGLGRIKAAITEFQLGYYGRPVRSFSGVTALATQDECQLYGFHPERPTDIPLPSPDQQGLRHVYDIKETWKDLLTPAVDDLVGYIETVRWPASIVSYTGGRNA
ncbi:MAG: CRISPR-associated RAMP protein [Acidobacteria bacterium]|nr:CRISPR-associated RAMP protein [Acidobacteriota bacterium]